MNWSKLSTYLSILFFLLIGNNLIAQSSGEMSEKELLKWFNKQEWLKSGQASESAYSYDIFGRVILEPEPTPDSAMVDTKKLKHLKGHKSINIRRFSKYYHANKRLWDMAFAFLMEKDLENLEPGKYRIDGDKVYATVTDNPSKEFNVSKWESHKKYADIHYIIKGKERIGIAPVSTAKGNNEYIQKRDLLFYDSAKGHYFNATPKNYFIFFPLQDAHRPNILIPGNETVKKVVIKIKVL
jgi:YhcH/YjgK/YiaL family protein